MSDPAQEFGAAPAARRVKLASEVHPRVHVRARELAMAQCLDHEIVSKLAADCDAVRWDQADAWVDQFSTDLERWRHEGQAELRKRIWDAAMDRDAAKELNGYQHATMLKLAEQHLGWKRESVSEQVEKAMRKAMREAGKSGPKGLRVAG